MGTVTIYISEDEEERLNQMKKDLFPADMLKKNNTLVKAWWRYCEKHFEDFAKELKEFLFGGKHIYTYYSQDLYKEMGKQARKLFDKDPQRMDKLTKACVKFGMEHKEELKQFLGGEKPE